MSTSYNTQDTESLKRQIFNEATIQSSEDSKNIALEGMINVCFKQCYNNRTTFNSNNDSCVDGCNNTYLQARQIVAEVIQQTIIKRKQ